MNDEFRLEELPVLEKKGIALDIDDTIAKTNYFWFNKKNEMYGNDEGLLVQDLIKKYKYAFRVPCWQKDEIVEFVEMNRNTEEMQKVIPVIEASSLLVRNINEIVPIVAYVTGRPQSMCEVTKVWLKRYGFVDAPVICRPEGVHHSRSNEWKARVLERYDGQIFGIVDDNKKLIEELRDKYKGVIFLYNDEVFESKIKVYNCASWGEVFLNVKEIFGK